MSYPVCYFSDSGACDFLESALFASCTFCMSSDRLSLSPSRGSTRNSTCHAWFDFPGARTHTYTHPLLACVFVPAADLIRPLREGRLVTGSKSNSHSFQLSPFSSACVISVRQHRLRTSSALCDRRFLVHCRLTRLKNRKLTYIFITRLCFAPVQHPAVLCQK